jgi:hypothetical protein
MCVCVCVCVSMIPRTPFPAVHVYSASRFSHKHLSGHAPRASVTRRTGRLPLSAQPLAFAGVGRSVISHMACLRVDVDLKGHPVCGYASGVTEGIFEPQTLNLQRDAPASRMEGHQGRLPARPVSCAPRQHRLPVPRRRPRSRVLAGELDGRRQVSRSRSRRLRLGRPVRTLRLDPAW